MAAHTFFSTYFPAPKFLDMISVGIDISSLSIRMVEIVERSGRKVGRFAEASLSVPFSITNADQKEAKDILRKWKKEYKLEYVKAALPEEKAYLFDTEIEFGTDEAMRSSIEFTLEENVPLSGSDVIFDYRLIGDSQKEKCVKVAVTVLPLEVVNAYIAFFKDCGLTPISFLIEAQGLSRALVPRGDLGTYLIVNIHTFKTAVFIISNGAVQFTSTVPIGSMDFTKALQKQFSVTAEEATKLKAAKGFTRTGDNETLGALVSTASAFHQEIEKVYLYWNKHRASVDASESIQKMIMAGKESMTPGFREYLSQTLKIPIEIGNVWVNVAPFDEYVPPIPLPGALSFGTAIGLALPENE